MSEDKFCICVLKSFVDNEPTDGWLVSFEFLFSFTICTVGVFLNWKFLNKLEQEKRVKQHNRKGNVIEPIMRWFCKLQIGFWPFQQLFIWSITNKIIPIEVMPNWTCITLTYTVMIGRCIIGYNSLFVALIRFIYIVYEKKANRFEFETVGLYFQIASVLVPFFITTLMLFTLDPSFFDQRFSIYSHCPTIYISNSENDLLKPQILNLTLKYLPESLVISIGIICAAIQAIALSNLVEGFLYIIIFKNIKR